ncbi:MAG: lamin tail domain-containing protein [Candidatus Sumerlaeia bacterium]|nr:lamin tail domain-containing protein [Candidatus Sumerlaeia bacterium]
MFSHVEKRKKQRRSRGAEQPFSLLNGGRRGRLNTRRGSTILLVISILSLLVLLAILMTFTSRVELSAANNAQFGVQNRTAARTGILPLSLTLLGGLKAGPVSSSELALLGEQGAVPNSAAGASSGFRAQSVSTGPVEGGRPEALNTEPRFAAGRQVAGNPGYIPVVSTTTAEIGIVDAAGLVNLNGASEQVLSRFFEAARTEFSLSYNSEALARAIIAHRYGPDAAPGDAGVDDDFDAPSGLAFTAQGATEASGDAATLPDGSSALQTVEGSASSYYDANSPRVRSVVEAALLESAREVLSNESPEDAEARHALRLALSTGVDEPDEYVGDLRRLPYGDDARLNSLEELIALPGVQAAGLSEDELSVLAPYMTLFSATELERLQDSKSLPVVDLNRASAETLFDALKSLYGNQKDERLLQQFAVNIVDFRDLDSIPTVYPGTSGASAIVGLERTVFISEVYADSYTPEELGDDGQFVELFNPWNEALSLSGLRLRAGGSIVPLNGTLPAGGYLIITDDADGREDDAKEKVQGTGSLYDVFGVIASGSNRQIFEYPSLSLSERGSNLTVELLNEDGAVVDVFTYSHTTSERDTLYSHQRENPLLRTSKRSQATPFALLPTPDPDAATKELLANSPQNAPFVSEADLFLVFSGFAPVSTENTAEEPLLWSFPVLGTPESRELELAELARRRDLLDARMLDAVALFSTLPSEEEQQALESDSGEAALAVAQAGDSRLQALGRVEKSLIEGPENAEAADALLEDEAYALHAWNQQVAPSRTVTHHRINVNTAPALVLQSLPGITPETARYWVEERERLLEEVRRGAGSTAALFARRSDLLVDDLLFPAALSYTERLNRLRELLPHVAFNSRSFRVLSQPRVEESQDATTAVGNRVVGLVATDRGLPEVLRLDPVRE